MFFFDFDRGYSCISVCFCFHPNHCIDVISAFHHSSLELKIVSAYCIYLVDGLGLVCKLQHKNDNDDDEVGISIRIPFKCLRCYTCTYVDPSPDKSCIMNSESEGQRTTLCSKKYCTIQRQETLNPPGKVVSFIRDCQDKPLYLNDIQTDSTFKVYYRSCTADLCNHGDGLQITSSADPDFGAGENLIVEGKSASTSSLQASMMLLLILGACILILC